MGLVEGLGVDHSRGMESKTSLNRLGGFDDLRWIVILLVVLVHANVTYSGIGSWYYVETQPETLDPLALGLMGVFGMFLQSWFMGLLFLLAGFWAVPSLQRRGSGFLRERVYRLLGPFALYVVVIGPLMLAAFRPERLTGDPLRWLSNSGPLWFTAALFLFLVVWVVGQRLPRTLIPRGVGWHRTLPWVGAALLITVLAWGLRVAFPIGTAVFNMQLGFFASYVVLFTIGTGLARTDGLQRLPSSLRHLAWLTPVVSVPLLLGFLVLSGSLEGDRALLGGGSLDSLGYALWESATGVAMALGLLVRYRDRSGHPSVADPAPWRRFLRDTSFGVYVLHAPVLWGLSLALAGVEVWAPVKALAVGLASFGFTAVLAAVARRIPGLGALLR